MIPEPDRLAIQHVLESGERITKWTKGGKRRFLDDLMLQRAIEREFEVMGEAARRVSAATREAHPQVPWRTLARFRDFLIHAYDSVDPGKVWDAVSVSLKQTLPPLRDLVR